MADVMKQLDEINKIRAESLTENQAIGLEVVDGHAVKAPADYQDPDELYRLLIERVRRYHPSADVSLIEKAYRIAKEAHEGQYRKSGEAYIIHPLWVAIILANLELDKETIVAGMLHDVVEDTIMTEEEIEKEFGGEVALLVDGVTKLGQMSYSADKLEAQAENLRKMFLAMAKDIRVIIIKLADRLHNMRTLQFMRPEKQKEKARETMDIYAPIAQRLGISKIKHRRQDQPHDRRGRRFRRSHGRPGGPEGGPEVQPLQLPADARHGPQRGRSHRFGGGGWDAAAVLPVRFASSKNLYSQPLHTVWPVFFPPYCVGFPCHTSVWLRKISLFDVKKPRPSGILRL